ncbi:MAG: hypothetical protein WBP41_16775 [Saprospiraceae bacterium]
MKYGFWLMICFVIMACAVTKHPTNENSGMKYLILNPSIRIVDFDPLGHVYILDENDRLSKYDTTGQLLCHVVNNNLGEANSLDVGNPFKTFVFYRDQQTILIYDRTLSEIQRIRLSDWGLHDVTAAGLSPDNAIWVFDGTNRVLVRLDDHGNALLTSDPFDIIGPGSPRPDFIFDMDQYLLLKESNHPISVFDDFGKFLYNADINKDTFFSVSTKYVVTGSGKYIQMYDIAERKYVAPVLLKENVGEKKIYPSGGRYYVVDGKGIYKVNSE